jgi:molybdopterin-guanine dinucleotide biosynthesis protein A
MNISAVLLAGGESRRMGKDKASLLFRGKPLWKIQLDLLRRLEPAEVFVSARCDPSWRPSVVQFVADDPPSRGPLSGLAATLGQIRTSHLLALAIDMPFMTEKYLRSLCDHIEAGRGVLPIIGHRAEPLAAIYPAEVHVDLAAALSSADFSLQNLTKQLVKAGKLRVIPVAKEEEALFCNLNQPADVCARASSPDSAPRSG